jgi:hypothetical protein
VGMPSLPTAVELLQDQLVSRGFRVADIEYSESHFGDTVILLVSDELRVRLIRDRGQWLVVVGSRSFEEWFSPSIWRDYFEGKTGPLSASTWEEQSSMVLDNLEKMRSAVLEENDLLEQLRDIRSARADARWGKSNT